MKNLKILILFAGCLANALLLSAQNDSFESLFKAAMECTACSDSEKIVRFTRAIDFGTADPLDFENFANALINRGTLYMETGKYQEAIADFQRFSEMKPEARNVLQKLGTAYLETGEYTKAIAQYDEYITMVENQKQQILMKFPLENDSTTAISVNNFNREMRKSSIQELDTRLARAYNNRGIAKAHLKNMSDACADFRKAYNYGMVELKGFIKTTCN